MLRNKLRIQSGAILINDITLGTRCLKEFRNQTTEKFVLETFISLAATSHMITLNFHSTYLCVCS